MLPESKLIRSELNLRELALPHEILLAKKSMIRWLALALGMIMPNESRKLLLDVLEVLVDFHLKNETPTTKDIISKIQENTKSEQNPKAIYYHLLRLKTIGLINRKKGRYYLSDENNKKLKDLFRDFYLKKIDAAFSNITVVLEKLENSRV